MLATYTNIRTSNIDSWDFHELEDVGEMVLLVQTNQKIVVDKGTAIPSVTAL